MFMQDDAAAEVLPEEEPIEPTEDDEELDEETKAAREELRAEGKKVYEKAKEIQKVANEPLVKKTIVEALAVADNNILFKKLRDYWDGLSPAKQMIILHFPSGPVANVHAVILQAMIDTGLITYKRAQTDEEIKEMGTWDKIKAEVAGIIIPEMGAVKEFLMPIIDMKQNFYQDIRNMLRDERSKREEEAIEHKIHDKVEADLNQ